MASHAQTTERPEDLTSAEASSESSEFTPNKVLMDLMKCTPSAEDKLPDGSPARIDRPEAVDAINAIMKKEFPGIDFAKIYGGLLDDRELGRYERGEVHWPSEYRRTAMRIFFGVDTDKKLGFSRRRLALQPVLDPQQLNREDGSEAAESAGGAAVQALTGSRPAAAHRGRSRTVDASTAHPARVYDYWLGGKDNFAVDRAFADTLTTKFPWVPTAARSNRDFRVRAVEAVAAAGVRQFLDIGTGLPAPGNTHEVAQRITPQARVLYVDNDPMVGVHQRALMTGSREGRTDYVEADIRQPRLIFDDPALANTLDLREPVCLVLAAVLHFIPDLAEAQRIVRALLDPLPSGSFLIVSHGTPDFVTPQEAAEYERMYTAGEAIARTRTKDEIATFFTDLDILDPGYVAVSEWRPADESDKRPKPHDVSLYGVVGRVR
ncbi:SAM-dependent methyltransferase [Actinoplanes sp. L3-i22]|uniref:SAM-dependent methyltransferase n=1 Tax=Actinoplanes sp. L3-i22 TaxID=2836373 RepID=UPI001C773F72|nr:SAM-dependent methyltransferase [Actinoplanes sp. L3-i22]BCY11076.1 hypothetical protein L3i22_061640 [Actinoplanes sp. L3-i22]